MPTARREVLQVHEKGDVICTKRFSSPPSFLSQVDGGWGYCSPQTVFTQDSCLRDDKQFFAVVGDCERYIQCRGQTPVLSRCEAPLNFDYILRSCTFEKDARCIGDVDVQ